MKKLILSALLIVGLTTIANSQSSYWAVSWNLASGLGETGDFVGNVSARGFSVEGRYFVTENMTIGGLAGWNTLFEKSDNFDPIEIEIDGNPGNITGTQYHYLNVLPILVTSHYYLNSGGGVTPYAGIGLGGVYVEQRNDIGLYSLYSDTFGFGVQPEVGVFIPFNPSGVGVNVSLRYLYGTPAAELDSLSMFTFAVGFGVFN